MHHPDWKKKNIRDRDVRLEEIDEAIRQKQTELLDAGRQQEKIDEQTEAITEYSDAPVRRPIARITVYDEMLVVGLKSGLEIQVEE